jgi:opacity protein-like surface antigen
VTVVRIASALFATLIALPALAADPGLPIPGRGPAVIQAPQIQDRESFYVALRGGIAAIEPLNYRIASLTTPPQIDIRTRHSLGGTGMVAFGYEFGEVAERITSRFEFEFGYSSVAVQTHQRTRTSPAPTVVVVDEFSGGRQGQTNVFTAMLGYYLDFQLGPLRPYIGGGVGIASVAADRHALNTPAGMQFIMNDRDTKMAWQAGLGLAFEVARGITLDVGYRLLRVEDVNLTTRDSANVALSSKAALSAHQFLAGVRVRF